MITRALDGGTAARWVAGDEVYGADPGLRRAWKTARTGYVLAVACSHRVRTAAGRSRADTPAACCPASVAAAVRRPGRQGPPPL